MTDLDQRIHEDLERLTSLAPLPPTVAEIGSRRSLAGSSPRRLPVLVALAAAAMVIAAVVGAVALRHAANEDDGSGVTEPPPPTTETEPDVVVFMNPNATQAQIDAIRERLMAAPAVVDVVYFDHDQAFAEFSRLYGDDPALVESVTREDLPTSFRVTLVDHDLVAASDLLTELEQSPGVREVQDEPVLEPPAEVSNDVVLPRLIVDRPGWGAPIVVEDSANEPLEFRNDEQTVIYQSPDEWFPMLSVLTTGGGYGLGRDNRTVTVAGHQAMLSPRYGTTQVIGWVEDGETMALTGFGVEEADLLTAAESLVRNPDGRWELSEVPDGMAERFRSGAPTQTTGRSREVRLSAPGGDAASLYASTGGDDEFWSAVTDVLFGGTGGESVTVRGVPGLLTGDDENGYRVDWLDRDGSVVMRMDLVGDRTEALSIIEHLVEVDIATWRELTGTDVAPTTTECAATDDTGPDPCGG